MENISGTLGGKLTVTTRQNEFSDSCISLEVGGSKIRAVWDMADLKEAQVQLDSLGVDAPTKQIIQAAVRLETIRNRIDMRSTEVSGYASELRKVGEVFSDLVSQQVIEDGVLSDRAIIDQATFFRNVARREVGRPRE